MNVITMDSPIGRLCLASDGKGLCGVRLAKSDETLREVSCPLLEQAREQLSAYFAGKRTVFDLPLSMDGTEFERAVRRLLQTIPFGQTRSYGEIAAQLGRPGAARAVGRACGRNPLLIVAACHRVVGASGRLTGFAAGMEAKRALLELEGWRVERDRLCLTHNV